MKIKRTNGMTNIDSKTFSFSIIDDLYTSGDGEGFQGDDNNILGKCRKVHDLLVEIEELESKPNNTIKLDVK
jgi:hypothetical protein